MLVLKRMAIEERRRRHVLRPANWPQAQGRSPPRPLRRCSPQPCVSHIDEAQWLNRDRIDYLRHLHDDLATKFALLLVGGNGCVLSREPMLRSRLFRRVPFAPLTPEGVPRLFSNQHERQSFAGRSVAHQDRDCGVVRFADSQRGRSLMIPMHGDTHD